MRVRHRPPTVARNGDMVIDGRVRARLLGLHLLEIDAHIVVGTAGPHRVVDTSSQRVVPGRRVASEGSAPPPLSQAVRLLAEGTSTLDDARRMRRLATEGSAP